MAQLVGRRLDNEVKAKLQERAKRHGRSTEEEVRDILRNAVKDDDALREGLGTRIAACFKGIGLRDGEEVEELRGQPARPAEFDR